MNPRHASSETLLEPSEEEIQKRAYFLWEAEGCPSGRDLEIWLAAREWLRHRAVEETQTARNLSQRMRSPRGAVRR